MSIGAAIETREGPTHAFPGEGSGCVEAITDVLDATLRVSQIPSTLTDVELTQAAQALAVLVQRAEASLIAITSDAIERGAVHRSTAADAGQWIARLSGGEPVEQVVGAQTLSVSGPLLPAEQAPVEVSNPGPALTAGMEPAHANRLAKLADACRSRRNQALRQAIDTGAVNSTTAKTALDNIDKIAAVLPKASRDDIYGWFLDVVPGSNGAKAVRELTRRVVAHYGQDQLDKDEDKLQQHESLSWCGLASGFVRFTADLSPDHAAMVQHALHAISAPAPQSDCCDDVHHRHDSGAVTSGEPDRRPVTKRRADALMLLIRLGALAVDDDSKVAANGTARIVVTMDFQHLTGQLAGAGIGQDGSVISPDTVRQLACDAEIVPMVLGSPNRPLNLGRKSRLVDKELRDAVIHRDQHCTYDGCTRPPAMCEVHHVKPWSLMGETSLRNSALLCGTHHRIVHRDRLTAAVTAHGVTWNHQPGSMHRSA